MPHDYIAKTHQFRGLSRHQVRAEIDKLVERIRRDAAKIGKRYERGSITLAEFELEMRELLKSGNIVAASVGRGGISRMTVADWGRVGSKLRTEYGYLDKFVRRLRDGRSAKAVTPNRAKRYADGVVMSYHRAVWSDHTAGKKGEGIKVKLVQNSLEGCEECSADASLGWIDVDEMTPLGDRQCGNFCRCDLVFSDDVEAGRQSPSGDIL